MAKPSLKGASWGYFRLRNEASVPDIVYLWDLSGPVEKMGRPDKKVLRQRMFVKRPHAGVRSLVRLDPIDFPAPPEKVRDVVCGPF